MKYKVNMAKVEEYRILRELRDRREACRECAFNEDCDDLSRMACILFEEAMEGPDEPCRETPTTEEENTYLQYTEGLA